MTVGPLGLSDSPGHALIAMDGDRYSYAVTGQDPLEHEQAPGAVTSEEWLHVKSIHPCAALRIHQLVTQAQCGDLILVADERTSFGAHFTGLSLTFQSMLTLKGMRTLARAPHLGD